MSTAAVATNALASDRAAAGLLGLAERRLVPDVLIRMGIRQLCAQRLREERQGGANKEAALYQQRIEALRCSPVAIHTDAANAQHYELPAAFFQQCLGPRMKYSSCYYPTGEETLAQAEEAMLALYGERAQLADGQDILELGCGWGSLTLWMAERFPNSRITAVSNSNSQRIHIQKACGERGIYNVRIITSDVNALALDAEAFDRCVSIEMFEHMRNYETLLARIAGWLRPSGKLFLHIFAHQTLMYPFETEGGDNWMGRHFFTGGLMPSVDTLLWFQRDLFLEERWKVDGTHYQRTANDWLANQDRHEAEVMRALTRAYGTQQASLWFQRWRMFWMACAELFGYDHGQQWLVAHYRFARPD
ncbi:class I SAM-dependent methyltransferase [Dyella dinghuensis]|uniref:Class I SAM-dependent methyltransferase n=1 Tax=Dyella dinghuensis TaxID=1920169 RepID=A0A3S0WPL8_9GAMM|nr:cyclopropane-fatty-acyl-phospholipid synthase family protein [Dyella dinghuensis]RUL64395.1 class I SAM-dependent methyltransferase [Dyella dinghuensis]